MKRSLFRLIQKPFLFLFLFAFIFQGGCVSAKKTNREELPETPLPAVETSPGSPGTNEDELETIAILGTNDIHGELSPATLKTREKPGVPSVSYEAGGVAVITGIKEILKSEYKDRLLWLDAGDEFQGSFESNTSEGAPIVRFFNSAKLDAAAIGNHEFDFGLDPLRKRMKEADYPYVASNLFNKTGDALAKFPNTHSRILRKVGNLRVGIIGLSTLETPETTKAESVVDLHFENLRTSTLREAKALRDEGAQIVLLTAHVGITCLPGSSPVELYKRKASDPQGACGEQDEMVQLLRSLPRGTVDGVVSGHSHRIIHHWIAGVPVIQGGAFGRYLNVIYLTYNKTKKLLLPSLTRIEGPIPVCTSVFENQQDCYGSKPAPSNGRGPLVPYSFHGKPVLPDVEVQQIVDDAISQTQRVKNRVLATAFQPIDHPTPPVVESELGNLTADAMRRTAQSDFAIINAEGVRAPLESGPITYGNVYKSIPFENSISILNVYPHELLRIFILTERGDRGLGSVSGIHLKLLGTHSPAPLTDINEGFAEPLWVENRVLDMHLPNGRPLDPDRLYSLAIPDFLTKGGDGLGPIMHQIPKERIRTSIGTTTRGALIHFLETEKMINSPQKPLFIPNSPRLKFESRANTKKHSRKN